MTFLNPGERQTLTLVCDTLIPRLQPEDNDDETLFRLSASDLNIPQLYEEALERITNQAERMQFRLFLRTLENPIFNAIVAGHWHSFSRMQHEAREDLLFKLATSRLERLRSAFLTVKKLAMFLFYSVMPDSQPNPTWAAYGYCLPTYTEARPKSIKPLEITTPTTLETEILVIGSGAGGGVVAGELATAGYDVLVVEKGAYYAEADYDGVELTGMERLYEKYGALVTDDTCITLLAGSALGGGTVVNWMTSLRPKEYVLQEWEREHGFTGALGADLQHSFNAVSKRVNVNTDESFVNPNNARLEAGCHALGYSVNVISRNAKGCRECGFCNYGCAYGGKQSTLNTYLQDAYDAGARMIVRGHVDRVLHSGGKVRGAVLTVTDQHGTPHEVTVKAKVVVVSAGAIHTPAVLRRSGLSNPNIGANLHLHPVTVVSGVFEDPIMPWQGPPQSRATFDFINLDGQGYGFWLETAPVHPGIFGLVMPWLNARHHKRLIQQLSHLANIIILTRDRHSGRIKLDRAGQPVVQYRLHPYDAKHLMEGLKTALRVHVAAGAVEVAAPHNNRPVYFPRQNGGLEQFLAQIEAQGLKPNAFGLFSAHQMSSCRIGGDPARGALKPTGESYEVKNLFVADGSVLPNAPGVNPMLTIMAVSHHIAQQIKTVLQ